jgi:hypothetical protein
VVEVPSIGVVERASRRSAMAQHVRASETAKEIDCAWCGGWFDGVVELISHVETDHLDQVALDTIA